MAWQRRRPAPGLVHHSDQGNQYRATLYQLVLARRGVGASMSRKGNCDDNAPVESFFSSLKNELVRHRQFQNQAEARQTIMEYIEEFYHRQRGPPQPDPITPPLLISASLGSLDHPAGTPAMATVNARDFHMAHPPF